MRTELKVTIPYYNKIFIVCCNCCCQLKTISQMPMPCTILFKLVIKGSCVMLSWKISWCSPKHMQEGGSDGS